MLSKLKLIAVAFVLTRAFLSPLFADTTKVATPEPTPVPVAAAVTPKNSPSAAVVTQLFGENPESYSRFGVDGHTGEDIGADCGDPEYSPADGTVVKTGVDKDYGNFIRILDVDGWEHILGHNTENRVKDGDTVKAGDVVGIVGKTGNSTGCHIHWGVKPPKGSPLEALGKPYAGYVNNKRWVAMREAKESAPTSCVKGVPEAYSAVICEAVKVYPADPALLAAILYKEHGKKWEADPYNPKYGATCSPAGACGAAQFMPVTFKGYGVDADGNGKPERESFKDSVYSAANLLVSIKKKTGDDIRATAIEYNCGGRCYNRSDEDLLANRFGESVDYYRDVVRFRLDFSL